jgi:choline dehydrogenase-like flavoprotein
MRAQSNKAMRKTGFSRRSICCSLDQKAWEDGVTKALERTYDGIIIGAGHHGLILGSYLAKAGLNILLVDRRAQYGGGLTTKEVTAPGFYHNLHSINHFHISETRWFKDLGLGDRVTYITPRYEFGQAHSDGTALVFGRDREETIANVARFSNKGRRDVPRLEPSRRRSDHRANPDPRALCRAFAASRTRGAAGENRDRT